MAPSYAAHVDALPVVLVTGASSGLGQALARRLASGPWRVVLTARPASLGRFAAAGIRPGERLEILGLDVTDAEQRRAAVDRALERFGRIDALVNNAGVAYRSVLEHVRDKERLAQMDVNFLAPMELVRLVLPGMRAQRSGRIVNVSSVGGMMAMPTMAVYAASKFALEGASEALWYEVRPFGVHVTLVEPGFIHSTSFENTRFTADSAQSLRERGDPYHAHYEHMEPFIARLMAWSRSTPDFVAWRIERALTMRSPPLRMSGTPDAFLFAMLRRVMPRRLYHAALYRALPQISRWGAHGGN
ncbi:MAG: SDR family oxidoreductase [Planctomycetota bacterium]|nr:SDR family oxidoreductase [Planctomycetota bacterium]